jgi:hypothetical protein
MAEAMPSAFMSWQFCGGRGFSHGRQTADSSLCSEWQFLAGMTIFGWDHSYWVNWFGWIVGFIAGLEAPRHPKSGTK